MLNKFTLFCASALIAALIGSPVAAQTLEEVVVTATKREQTLQDVPVAVSVTDSETLQQAQIIDVLDLQSVVPSLRITQLQTSGNTNFLIRGFGNGANNPGIEPSVGVFIDGVYRSRSSGAISDLTDIERIEVLRGPQSTLFGKNASAGVISVITAKPDYEFSGMSELTVGNFNALRGRARVSGPINDKIAYSLSANGNMREGYFNSIDSPNDTNERERWGVRGQLLFEPSDRTEIRVIADFDKIDEFCCGVSNLLDGPTGDAVRALGGDVASNAPFSYEGFFNIDSVNDIENSGISVQADVDFDRFKFTSITSFRSQDKLERSDSDFTSADLIGSNTLETELDTFTQEFRINSTIGENVDWMLGLFYFDEEVKFDNVLLYGDDMRGYAEILSGGAIGGLEGLLGVPANSFFQAGQGTFDQSGQDDQALSIFGQVDWHLTDRLTLTLGLNNTNNEKESFVNVDVTDPFNDLDFVQIGFAGLFGVLTGGQAPTPANFAAFPDQFALAQQLSVTPCSPTTGPLCNEALGLQPLQFLSIFLAYPNAIEDGKSDDNETTWTVRLAFDINDNYNMYFNAATGFKATSWNLSRDSRPFPSDLAALQAANLTVVNQTTGTRFASPEEATVYEIGLKAKFDSGAFNISVFDQTIEGFQSNIFTGTGFALANAGEQSSVGFEFDGVWLPNESWKLTLAGTFLDPEYDSFPNGNGVGGPQDLSGTEPAGIHGVSLTSSATYYHDFGPDASGFFRVDYLYEDDVQVNDNVSAEIASREVSSINASAGISWENGLDLTLWGRNLNNDTFLYSSFPAVAQAGSFSGYPNTPRTFGITVRKQF